MPLVRIDLREGRPPAERESIGAAVHQAMTETIDVPHDDVFQVIAEHGSAGLRYDQAYLGIERDDGIVFVQITMRSGRTREQKRALYRRVTELLEESAGVRPANVLIALCENGLEDWSFGDGRAQLLDQS
jgi:phenylpyruvate tautomerase PptA (4-oxalocrotonate tautomerase family)